MQHETKHIIPIAFVFDDAFALPAWVSIQSLISSCKETTFYEIFIVYSRLSEKNKKHFTVFNGTNFSVQFVEVDNSRFINAPSNKGWPFEVYYRLILPELFPGHDRMIYSDVDVMFKGDLASVYLGSLDAYQCAAVAAERMDEKDGFHQKLDGYENSFIFMSGFLVLNLKRMREENIVDGFFEAMNKYKGQLRMFDLEILNLVCGKIKPLPFSYCVLENLYYLENYKQAREYRFLKNTYTEKEIVEAIHHPIIIHYAGGKVKIWKQKNPDPAYLSYILQSPYKNDFMRKKYLKNVLWFFNPIFFILSFIIPIPRYRKTMRLLINGNF